MAKIRTLSVVAAAFGSAALVSADPIAITGYNITDAVLSGHGNWFHDYDGTINSGAAFEHNGNPGETAEYTNFGSGTLNDGFISTTPDDNMLFVNPRATDGTPITPVITLELETTAAIDVIEIFGGDNPGNVIPGEITACVVTLVGPGGTADQRFEFEPFGGPNAFGNPTNDRINIAGSSLEGFAADQIILSDWEGGWENWFSITEVTVDGGAAGPRLAVSGNCPGNVTLDVSGATPNENVAFIFAFGTGNVTIPSGICQGTQLGLDGTAQLVGTATADANGNAQFTGFAPNIACRGFLQALDLTTCTPSNVGQF
ncbi:MAG: hypothetical protein ACOC0P_05505 [Planctomycetota bacterium]